MGDHESGPHQVKPEEPRIIGRRSMLANVSAGAVAGLALGAGSAAAQTRPQSFEPARHALDAWLDELEGSHRVLIDSSTPGGGANALRYANNIIVTHEDAYSGTAADMAVVVVFRHMSTPYGWDDAIWAKYGAIFDSEGRTTNPMNARTGGNGGNPIGPQVERGVQFAICQRATRANAARIASRAGVPVDDVVEELMAGGIPNSRFVPAGVMTVTRAQEYGYSMLYAE